MYTRKYNYLSLMTCVAFDTFSPFPTDKLHTINDNFIVPVCLIQYHKMTKNKLACVSIKKENQTNLIKSVPLGKSVVYQ